MQIPRPTPDDPVPAPEPGPSPDSVPPARPIDDPPPVPEKLPGKGIPIDQGKVTEHPEDQAVS